MRYTDLTANSYFVMDVGQVWPVEDHKPITLTLPNIPGATFSVYAGPLSAEHQG